MAEATDTIAAIATPAGRGGVGIIRLSGPRAFDIARSIGGELPPPRRAGLRDLRDAEGEVIDRGLVLCFVAPDSFTGEQVVELQAHGGPVLLELLLAAACAAGARRARPGEFSERAFLNGRLDLVQAESIADLIDAASAAAVRAASRSLQGEFSQVVNALVEELILLRADLEAALDFADEDLPWIDDQRLSSRLAVLVAALADLQRRAAQGRRLRDGLVVAIAGRPNVGKSTLLNALAAAETAIVSPIAGTTRDLLREHLLIDGLPLTLIDTAGLRETADPIEAEGVRRAWTAVRQADAILFLVDDSSGVEDGDLALLAQLPDGPPRLTVFNKCDLSGNAAGLIDGRPDQLRLSAESGAGVETLKEALKRIAGLQEDSGSSFAARARHLDALARAATPLAQALALSGERRPAELIAEELRQAQAALGEITGRITADDLLGRIFSTFCIGK
jgi:tRNA modification GTPase